MRDNLQVGKAYYLAEEPSGFGRSLMRKLLSPKKYVLVNVTYDNGTHLYFVDEPYAKKTWYRELKSANTDS